MAYQTGTSTGAADLLGIISTFAVSQGFVQEQLVDANGGKWLTLSYQGMYYHLASRSTPYDRFGGVSETIIEGYLSTGFNAGSAWNAQPGTSVVGQTFAGGYTNGMDGPFYAYHLFADAQEIHCVIEISSIDFAHINFGVIEKTYSGTGGHFITGTFGLYNEGPATLNPPFDENITVYAPMESNYYYGLSNATHAPSNYIQTPLEVGNSNSTNGYFGRSYSSIDGSAALMPITLHFSRPDSYFSYLGHPASARYVSLQGLQPRQEVTLGSETWQVFPIFRKSGTDWGTIPEPASGYFGMAYKKVL